jgi:hypothetical protein
LLQTLEESTTYQYILEHGATRALKRLLLRLGAKKFGAPTKAVKAAIESLDVDDLPQLERMAMRVLTANSWGEVLDTR